MVKNLEPKEMYNFIVNDFINVWDSVANNSKEKIAERKFSIWNSSNYLC